MGLKPAALAYCTPIKNTKMKPATITGIGLKPSPVNNNYQRIFITTNGFDENRHRLILRVSGKFHDELTNFFFKDLVITADKDSQNILNPLFWQPETSIYAQLFDYKEDKVIATFRQDFSKSFLVWQKEEALQKVSENYFNLYWHTNRKVAKVQGPYDQKGNLVTSVKEGESYQFLATPNQKLNKVETLSVKWGYRYDDGDFVLFKNHSEKTTADGKNMMTCSFHKDPSKIKVYAFFVKESEDVMVEFSNSGKASETENDSLPSNEDQPVPPTTTENGICIEEARVRAFMRMVRVGEATGELIKFYDKKQKKTVYIARDPEKGYRTAFGGNTITDLSTHPQKNYGGSTAAGAYQIMRYTWWWLNGEKLNDDNTKAGVYEKAHDYVKKYKIKDYSPASQDKLCVIIFKHKQKGLLDLIVKDEIEKAIRNQGSGEWASLPHKGDNSRYKFNGKPQPATPFKVCMEHYNKFLKEELEGKSYLHLEKGFLKEFGITTCNKQKPADKEQTAASTTTPNPQPQNPSQNNENPQTSPTNGIITYHIFNGGKIEKHVPKTIQKGFEKKYKYIYHDKASIEHILGTFNFKLTTEINQGNKVGTNKIELVDVREFKGYSNGGVKLKFLTLNTESERYYINPDCYAGLLGAMADQNIDFLGFNGFSNYQGKSTGGSSSHRNGEKGDLRYLSKNKKGEATYLQHSHFDVINQNKFNDALYNFGWGRSEKMYSEYFTYNGNNSYLLNHTKHMRKDGKNGYRHYHHLHLTGFNHQSIKVIRES